MPDPSEHYSPQSLAQVFRKRAIFVWRIGTMIALVWVALILTPAVAKANGLTAIASPLYHFFGYICHQIPSRSFHIAGEQFGVCSRCFGVYFGLLVGFAIYPLWRNITEIDPLPRFWLFLSLIPISIDWSLTIFGIWENTYASRFITGLILGIACATYIIPALVELTRNRSRDRSGRWERMASG